MTTVDPLAEKHYTISPYSYCSGNPINRIDPNGMDDYIFTKEGKLVLALKTDNKNDKVYAMTEKGGIDKKKSMNISKDVISSKVTKSINTINREGYVLPANVDIFTSFENKQSIDFSEFLGENSNVEWTHIKAKVDNMPGYDEVNYLGTMYSDGDDASQLYLMDFIPKGVKILEAIHNHTNATTWVSQGDLDVATKIQTRFPNVKFFIYSRIYGTKDYQYTSYDMFSTPGLLKEVIVKP